MALNNSALVVAATAVEAAIGFMQLHSADPGPSGTSNAIGPRIAVNGSIDGDGDISWSNLFFDGLPLNGPVSHVSYWSSPTGGTYYGNSALTGDLLANVSGEYIVTLLTETSTSL